MDFLRNRGLQVWQGELHGVPYQVRCNILVVVPVDVACSRYVLPGNRRVTFLQLIGKAARRFWDDLKASGYRENGTRVIQERLMLAPRGELPCQADVVCDVSQHSPGVRRHRWLQR